LGVLACSSQIYALNAIHDPNTIRYASAHSDRALTSAHCVRHGSPRIRLTINSPAPPQSICAAAFIQGDAAFGTCFEYSDPPAQHMPATITPSAAINDPFTLASPFTSN